MKNLNTPQSLSIIAAMLALATPFVSHAGDADAAMDTCINAFVAAKLPKEQRVKVRKASAASTPIVMQPRAYKIVVTARGADSGKHFAHGTCLVDRNGEVVALNGKALTQKLAAR